MYKHNYHEFLLNFRGSVHPVYHSSKAASPIAAVAPRDASKLRRMENVDLRTKTRKKPRKRARQNIKRRRKKKRRLKKH